jgi:hypothetical protein
MPRDRWEDESLDESEDEDELFDDDADDDADDDSAELVDCPACGEPVYEDAEQCPYCGEYIVHSTSVLSNRSPWTMALFLAGVIAVIAMCVLAF